MCVCSSDCLERSTFKLFESINAIKQSIMQIKCDVNIENCLSNLHTDTQHTCTAVNGELGKYPCS